MVRVFSAKVIVPCHGAAWLLRVSVTVGSEFLRLQALRTRVLLPPLGPR